MIDKEKTIARAIAKYHTIFPVRGKHLYEECFACLRGEYYFTFMTKDKKSHCIKASETRPVYTAPHIRHEVFDSLLKALNTPIIIRSLITKKPVKTCLINLFPVPTISWSANTPSTNVEHEQPSPDGEKQYCTPHPAPVPTPRITETSSYALYPPYPAAAQPDTGISHYAQEQYPLQNANISYHYEILATGLLPVTPFDSWMPGLDETATIDTRLYHLAPVQQPEIYRTPDTGGNTVSTTAPQQYHTTTEELRRGLFDPANIRPVGSMPFLGLRS